MPQGVEAHQESAKKQDQPAPETPALPDDLHADPAMLT
ncbi:secreted effector protein [Roseibium sp. TrichSKD4]|nr:secreted effector protein [Roseibium sp. TrichSKD4]